ncbi:MAG: hypothetical protein ACM35H_00610 [Bacteroidota bacterium]
MARVTLKAGSGPEDLGRIILNAAYGRFKSAKPPSRTDVESALRGHLAEGASGLQINVHFDTHDAVNVVVPYLDEQEVYWPPPNPGEPGYHLWKIAYEAMGTVVIRGCGK